MLFGTENGEMMASKLADVSSLTCLYRRMALCTSQVLGGIGAPVKCWVALVHQSSAGWHWCTSQVLGGIGAPVKCWVALVHQSSAGWHWCTSQVLGGIGAPVKCWVALVHQSSAGWLSRLFSAPSLPHTPSPAFYALVSSFTCGACAAPRGRARLRKA